MKLTRRVLTAMALALAAITMVGAAAPGKVIKGDIAFTTLDLFAANATAIKCVKLGKAMFVHKVVCNCYTGTADLTVMDDDESVFPTATATQQATPLVIATGCTTSSVILTVDSSVISETAAFGEICIQAVAVGGEAALNCRIRATAGSHGKP
ncbi:hypothetical protein LCGC14_0460050 [marine sediment metagenome]|uniref:Uncharacterized protein n=1 Tax=marine sediment metagenome TaxID=412755 RepID=A0A0F9SF95_9ZZZZ